MRGSRRAIAIALCIAGGGLALAGCGAGSDEGAGGGGSSVSEPAQVRFTRAERRFQRRLETICQDANTRLHPPVRVESNADRERLARRQLNALERFVRRVDSLRVPRTFGRDANDFLKAIASSRDVTRQLIDKAADGLRGEVGLLIDAQNQHRDMRAQEAFRMGVYAC
jgi:hypothetical protein